MVLLKKLIGWSALLGSWGCGAMGQAVVTAESGDQAQAISAPLALGATLEPQIRARQQSDALPPLSLLSGRPDVIDVRAGVLSARASGLAPILLTTPDGVVVDFYHLWVVAPTHMALARRDKEGRDRGAVTDGLDLVVGESIQLAPKVFFGAQELAGRVSAEWSATPPICDFLREGVPGERRMLARSAGEATLRVAAAGVAVTLPVRVVEPPSAPQRTTDGPVPAPGGAP